MQAMVLRFTLLFVGMAFLSCSTVVMRPIDTKMLDFTPLSLSAATGSLSVCAPVQLPEGFQQKILIQESAQCSKAMVTLDAIADISDRTDMNTVNETGVSAGRFLYRTHETNKGRGAISVLDLQTGQAAVHSGKVFGGWEKLDGIEWTPWGTLLVGEEAGIYGRIFECRASGLRLTCEDRPAMGRMSHEGISVAEGGAVYLGDETDGGSIFKFVPNQYGDLRSGQLFALNIINGDDSICSGVTGTGFTATGQAEWIALSPGRNRVLTTPSINARAAAAEASVTRFCRPEDSEIIDGSLYVATTTTNTVLQIPITTDTPFVTEYVGIHVNINNEDDIPSYGLQSPDNLASDHAGNLYIVEDNDGKSDVWMATPDTDHDGKADFVVLFATLTTPGAEGSGFYISPTQPDLMFFNVQHAQDGNDMTLVISRPESK